MKMDILILLFYFLFSCNTKEQNENEVVNNSMQNDTSSVERKRDTTIIYFIEGISSEGTEAKVSYVSNKIKKAEIGIAGAEGQDIITYSFNNNLINVFEKQYHYPAGIESVKSANDMILEKEINYVVDFNGKVIGKGDTAMVDIFQEFKKAVPFELK